MCYIWRLASRKSQLQGPASLHNLEHFFTLSHSLPLHESHLNTGFLSTEIQANWHGIKPTRWLIKFNLTDANIDEEAESDVEVDNLCERMVAISVSKEEMTRIRAPWGKALIVKTFGRNVGFLFLSTRLSSMWMPVRRMDCIDIGNDFFLVRFEL